MIENTIWMTYSEYLSVELRQSEEEGKDIEKYRRRVADILRLTDQDISFEARERRAWELLDEMEKEPIRADYPYKEPDKLEEIRQLLDEKSEKTYLVDYEKLRDKIFGAWMGRCIGCLLGQPIEGWKRERIIGFLKDTDNYPVNRFLSSEVKQDIVERYRVSNNGENAFCDTVTHWINNISDMPEDDDTNYTVIGLKVLEEHGRGFDSEQMAQMWITSLPMGHVSTSERVAYRNIGNLIDVPKCGWWKNPYREWIGAQIRADIFGYVCPGNPKEAAEMAWKDGRISHVKNGIYGEMYIAAMLAAAYEEHDMVELIDTALGQIPYTSRLYKEIKQIMREYGNGVTAEQAINSLHHKFEEEDSHDWCHTITNAAVVTISILYSDNDFTKALGIAMECGYDTDCNGATVGSIMGLLVGSQEIPAGWKNNLTGVLRTGVSGYHQVKIEELAEKTYRLIQEERK